MADCRLYLITPPRIDDLSGFARTLESALKAGDVAAVQIRIKEGDAEAAARALTPVIQSAGAAAIINDDPELAARVKADGVHVGQKDASYASARATVGPRAIVGVTCHASRHLAMEAAEAGADYVAFGAFFPTATKAPYFKADVEILEWWSELFEVPCVAIGGITAENCAPLVKAGADFLAVSAGVFSHPNGAAAGVEAMNAAIAEASKR
jgi:thiamine-phosphate pyrophosphorylase